MSDSEKSVQSYRAGADLSSPGADSLVVRRSTLAGEVILTAATSNRPAGVIDLSGGASSGLAVRVVTDGRARVKAGGIIAVNTRVAGGANGKIAAAGSGDFVLGETEEAAGADNDVVTVFVRPSEVPLV
jgi:hypothetical protein